MYSKVLVAYNASKHSAEALKQGIAIARMSGAELHILGIVANTGGVALAGSAGAIDVLGVQHQRIQEALQSVLGELADQDVDAKTSISEGDPASEIIACAYRIHADLAVIGHSTKGALARWFQGSVGSRLLSELPCSLLIATERHPA